MAISGTGWGSNVTGDIRFDPSWQLKTGTVVPPPTFTPPPAPQPSISTGIDPQEFSQALYGKPIPISALGKARIGTAGVVFGPYFSNGTASFAVSFGYAVPVTGTRVLFEIAMNSKRVWSSAAGTATISAGTFDGETFTARFYQGTLTQSIDALETTNFGSEAMAYRPHMLIYFQNLPLAQFGGQIPFVSALIGDTTSGAVPADGINLGDALERIAHSPWLEYTSSTFETVGVTDIVDALILSDSNSFMDLLRNDARVYRSHKILQTDILRVVDRGATVTPDITFNRDRIVAKGVQYSRQEQNSVPRELELITIDPGADYVFMPSKAQTPRHPVAVTSSVGKETITFPVVIDATTAAALVHYAKYAEEAARKKITFTAMAYGYRAEPGDLIHLTGLADGFEDETFEVIQADHGANYTVQLTCEAILKCALPSDGSAEHVQDYNDEIVAGTTHTFTDADLGVANANRHTVIAVNLRMAATGQTITGITIGGVAADEKSVASNAGQGAISAIWEAATPTGATGDVVISTSGNFEQASIHVYRLISGAFALDDDAADQATTGSAVPITIDIPANGVVIAAGMTREGASFTWSSGMTEDGLFVNDVETTGQKGSASRMAGAAEPGYVISIDPSSSDRVTLAAASFVL